MKRFRNRAGPLPLSSMIQEDKLGKLLRQIADQEVLVRRMVMQGLPKGGRPSARVATCVSARAGGFSRGSEQSVTRSAPESSVNGSSPWAASEPVLRTSAPGAYDGDAYCGVWDTTNKKAGACLFSPTIRPDEDMGPMAVRVNVRKG